MSQQDDYKARTQYVHAALTTLAARWDTRGGRKGDRRLRAVFRRWRPVRGGEPTLEMCMEIWNGIPIHSDPNVREKVKESGPAPFQLETVNRAAVLVALRAIAGDHGGAPVSFGAALQRAGVSDLRLMRLLSTPRALRVEAMIRAFQRIAHARVDTAWGFRDTERLLNFLYGSEEAARWSINAWAGEFFTSRGSSATTDATIDADRTPDEQN